MENPTSADLPKDSESESLQQKSHFSLTEAQIDEIHKAEAAARQFPDRYNGFAERLKSWFVKFNSKLADLLDKNPNITEDDDEYHSLLRDKPTPDDTEQTISLLEELMGIERSIERLQFRINYLEKENSELKEFNKSLESIVNDLEAKIKHVEESDVSARDEVIDGREVIRQLESEKDSLSKKCAELTAANELLLATSKLQPLDSRLMSALDSIKSKIGFGLEHR